MPRKPSNKRSAKVSVRLEWTNIGVSKEVRANVTRKSRKKKALTQTRWSCDDH